MYQYTYLWLPSINQCQYFVADGNNCHKIEKKLNNCKPSASSFSLVTHPYSGRVWQQAKVRVFHEATSHLDHCVSVTRSSSIIRSQFKFGRPLRRFHAQPQNYYYIIITASIGFARLETLCNGPVAGTNLTFSTMHSFLAI